MFRLQPQLTSPDTYAQANSHSKALAVIAVAALVAYATSFRGGFQFDDWNVIVNEPRVHSLAAWWQAMPGIRPLLKLSYALNWQSSAGLTGFHAINLIIHIANAWLVYSLLSRRREAHRYPMAPLFAALIFALHPAQTEAVTYICGRSSSLVAFFSLASLLVWLAGRERRHPFASRVLSAILFCCALATKETAIVLPVAMLLWDITEEKSFIAACKDTIAHWAVLAAAMVATVITGLYRPFIAASLAARDFHTNALTQIEAVSYLTTHLVRVDQLNADPLLQSVHSWSGLLVVKALALGGSLVAGLFALRRAPLFAFGTLWFFIWLIPTNSIVPRLDVVNDRQLYTAMIGPAWLLASAAASLLRQKQVWAMIACALALGGLAACTAQRNTVYFTEVAFWNDVADKSPHNARAWNNLAYAYVQTCDTARAASAFDRALLEDATYVRAAVNLRLLKDGAFRCGH